MLRIEDLDRERCRPEFVDACLRDLAWLGLDWDGEVFVQSRDVSAYDEACRRLLEQGLAYPCTCTRAEIAALSAPHASDGEQRYAGTCRGRWRSLEQARASTGRDAGLRFVVHAGTTDVADRIHGRVTFDVSAEVGDFLIRRRDGAHAYQLAVVVDDARQGVDTVLRGADLLPSAARQQLLQRALGVATPAWIHVPLVLDEQGERLAKRRGDVALTELRAAGVDPRAVVAWAARASGIAMGGDERGSAAEFVERFDIGRLPSAAAQLCASDLAALRNSRL